MNIIIGDLSPSLFLSYLKGASEVPGSILVALSQNHVIFLFPLILAFPIPLQWAIVSDN